MILPSLYFFLTKLLLLPFQVSIEAHPNVTNVTNFNDNRQITGVINHPVQSTGIYQIQWRSICEKSEDERWKMRASCVCVNHVSRDNGSGGDGKCNIVLEIGGCKDTPSIRVLTSIRWTPTNPFTSHMFPEELDRLHQHLIY